MTSSIELQAPDRFMRCQEQRGEFWLGNGLNAYPRRLNVTGKVGLDDRSFVSLKVSVDGCKKYHMPEML
jgi:hypothetical protein